MGCGVSWRQGKMITKLNKFTTRRALKQFATRYHFVYFGQVSQHDDHPVIRGITAAASHNDNFYTVGSFMSHDITVLERKNKLSFPGKADRGYKWLIMQVDLKRTHMPHIFIDNQHHDETFFANMALTLPNLHDMSGSFGDAPPGVRVFINPQQYGPARMLLSPPIVAALGQLKHTDLEVKDDQLLIYIKDANVTLKLLEHMLQTAVWLADQINAGPQVD